MPGRTRLRVATAAVLVAGVISPAAAVAVPAHAPSLASRTTVIATNSSRTDVSLPKPVSLRYDKAGMAFAGIAVEGSGRYVGVSLVSLHSQDGLVQLLIRPCFSEGCRGGSGRAKPVLFATSWSSQPVAYGVSSGLPATTLPAGDYVLSVITDGTPATVRLTLPGLSGHATYRTRLPQHATALSPAEQVTGVAGAQPEAQSGGTGWVDTGVQLLAQTHVATGQAHVSDDSTWCVYDGSGPPGGVLTPGCPGAEQSLGFGGTYVTRSFDSEQFGMTLSVMPTTTTVPATTYYQGFLDYGVQDISTVHDNFLWASLGAPKQ